MTNFNIIECIRADLCRAKYLEYKKDFSKEGKIWIGLFSPRYAPILIFRLAYWCNTHHLNIVAKILSMFNVVFFGIEIAISCKIGRGFYLPHTQGTVIGAHSLGDNVTIFQGVTLGAKMLDFSYDDSLRPKVGDGVVIGAGAKIIGGVIIGSNAVIGANSVVLEDIPSDAVAFGVPAKYKFN